MVSLLLLFAGGCSRENRSEVPASVRAAPEAGVVEVEHPELYKLVKVQLRPWVAEFSANGVVAPDVSRTVHVTSLSSGRVLEIKARLGDFVSKGQVLLIIASADVGSSLADYRKFAADERLARSSLERTKDLYGHGALPLKELQAAENMEEKPG